MSRSGTSGRLSALAAALWLVGLALRRQGALAEACRSYGRALEMMRNLRARAVPPVPATEQIDALMREQAPCAGRS